MRPLIRAVYHRLPPPVRSAAATAHGYRLRRWRYGEDAEALVSAALERDQWGPEQWQRWQEERLAETLHRAATRVPYYRAMWTRRRLRGDRRSWDRLEHWPILAKDAVREAATQFVADDCDRTRMYHEHTSGTSGKSLDLWWSRKTVRAWFALLEARCRRWHGVTRHDRWAILGGQLVVPATATRPPYWVWNAAMSQLYMSTYHIAPGVVSRYLDAIASHRVRYLLGYPSALYELALGALQAGRTDVSMQVVIANAEPLYPHQRAAIESAFHCPVRDTYGMAEIVAAASECPAGRLHLWPEVGVVELVDDEGAPVPGGHAGNLVATGLLNTDMPLVRYATGDRVARSASDACACGRSLPALSAVEGRADDVVTTADGRRIGRLDTVFKSGLPVIEAQIVQESPSRLRVRYVPGPAFDAGAARRLTREIRAHVGNLDIVLDPVAQVPREANGKFRAVISSVGRGRRCAG